MRLLRVQLKQQPNARVAIAKRAKSRLEAVRLELLIFGPGWQHDAVAREDGLLPALHGVEGGLRRAACDAGFLHQCAHLRGVGRRELHVQVGQHELLWRQEVRQGVGEHPHDPPALDARGYKGGQRRARSASNSQASLSDAKCRLLLGVLVEMATEAPCERALQQGVVRVQQFGVNGWPGDAQEVRGLAHVGALAQQDQLRRRVPDERHRFMQLRDGPSDASKLVGDRAKVHAEHVLLARRIRSCAVLDVLRSPAVGTCLASGQGANHARPFLSRAKRLLAPPQNPAPAARYRRVQAHTPAARHPGTMRRRS